jgi:hypothetical protein
VLAPWLLTAVVKIVTTYTEPGDRVLLLPPPPFITPPAGWPTARDWTPSRPGPYDGLLEAAWTVVRLGRGIQTQAPDARPDPVDDDLGAAMSESESGLGLVAGSPTSDTHAKLRPDRPADSGTTATGHGHDRFDLIISAVDARTLDSRHLSAWADLLTSNGILAVITHGERVEGWITDPAGALVRGAHHAGLHYLDRIALLTAPIHDGALALGRPAGSTRSPIPPGRPAPPVRHIPVHDDLLVFTPQPAVAEGANTEESSDD